MDFIDHRSTAQFTFLTSATDEKIRINTSGDLLVGISTPFDTSGITLDATGALGVDGHITVATGATYDIGTATNKFRDLYLSGDINVAGVSTSGNLTVGGSLSVTTDATITNDLTVSNDATVSGDLTVSTNAVIAGDLTVNGTTTTINTETLDVKDKNITLNYGGDTTSADGAGITIEDAVSAGTDATILWDGSTDTFDFSHAIDVTGTISGDNTLSIQNSTAYGAIEVGGVSGGFIDIKSPFSDDYDLRLISEGSGGVINVASGELTIQRAGSAKLATTSTGIAVTGNATFADNGKAIFGAGSDLQIYHDANDSYISDQGSGNLKLLTDEFRLRNAADSAHMLTGSQGGGITAYHNGNTRLATTSTGIDVTGVTDTDGITSSAEIDVNLAAAGKYFEGGSGGVRRLSITSGTSISEHAKHTFDIASGNGKYVFAVNSTDRLSVDSSGIDVTGSITSSGSLTVNGSNITLANNNTDDTNKEGHLLARQYDSGTETEGFQVLQYFANSSGNRIDIGGGASSYNASTGVNFYTAANTTTRTGTKRLGIASNGDVSLYEDTGTTAKFFFDSSTEFLGLGSTAPAAKLDIVDTSADVQMRVYKNDGTKNTRVTLTADDSGAKIHYRDADNAGALRFNNNLGEVMRIPANTTRLGIGTTNPDGTLHISGTGTAPAKLIWERSDGGVGSKNWTAYIDNTHDLLFGKTNDSGTLTHDYLHIEDGGNIGINTSSPEKRLHIFDSTQTNQTIRFGNPSATPLADINYDSSGFEHLYISVKGTTTGYGNIVFSTGPTPSEAMRLDASGNASLGTATPLYTAATRTTFTINGLGSSNLSFGANGTGYGNIFVASNEMNIGTQTSANPLKFVIGGSEKARLDGSGNLLVGKTSASSAVHGGEIRATGQVVASVDGSWAGLFNRETSDGEILRLKQDDVTVGTVGTVNGDMYLGTGDTGFFFSDSGNYIMPYNTSTLGLADGLLDLGRSTNRWKDLHLSGTAYIDTAVGIGTSSPAAPLSFGSYDTGARIYLRGNTNEFAIGTNTQQNVYAGYAGHIFQTGSFGGTERMRLDASGNLLVGTTDLAPAVSNSEVGVALSGSYGYVAASRSAGASGFFNRLSDGDIVNFNKDGTTIGSIGTRSSGLVVGSGDTGLFYDSGGDRIFPESPSGGAARDAAIDLGTSAARFKDLHMSGTANVGSVISSGQIKVTGSNASGVAFSVGDAGTGWYNTGSNSIGLATAGSERARFTSIGTFLVGKTAEDNTTAGIRMNSTGDASFVADGNRSLVLNRKTSDGHLAVFLKDNSEVGVIGTQGGDLNIGTGACGVQFVDGVPALYPWSTTSNATSDNAIDLGDSGARFKDLYLSNDLKLSNGSYIEFGDSGTSIYGSNSLDVLLFTTAGSERTRIDSSGNQLWGKSSADNTTQGIRFLGSSGFMSVVRSNNTLAVFNRIDGDGTLLEFRTSGTTRGSISISGSTTSYNTTSDERAKENIVDAPSASDDIDAIRVRSFDFKADGSHQKYGMVAQELGTVAPEAVSVPDDAEEMQSVDYSKLVPMLVKEIQSLRARVAQLEGEN